MPHWKTQGRVPAFSDAKLIDQWSGAMYYRTRRKPHHFAGHRVPGLVLNTATGWGMTESPVSSELSADLLLGKAPVLDPKPFSLYRF
jgi:glycine/D-amino acid oxidase-like deaminating enzyme